LLFHASIIIEADDMEVVRPLALFAVTGILSGCNLFSSTNIGRNTTVENSFPNGLPTARSQAPSDPAPASQLVLPQAITPSQIEPVSNNVPAKKNETVVKVIATIGTDSVITDEEVWHMVRQKPEQYAALIGEARQAKEAELFKSELKQLISREMIIADFTAKVKKNKPTALDELNNICIREADRNIKNLMQNLKVKNEDELGKVLGDLGVTEKGLRRQYQRNVMVDLFVGPTIRDKVKTIGLAELRDYYDANPQDFKVQDRAKWMYITVLTSRFKTADEAKQYANWLSEQAAKGVDFNELVKKYGMGDSALRGGEGIGEKIGDIRPQELEATIFSMTKAGQVSQPVSVPVGYHVVKLLERDLAGVKPFDEKVQSECRGRLAAQIQKKEIERLTEDLVRKYRPRVLE
jgi:peptidyl-prolyl cis-trans isomerase SurA